VSAVDADRRTPVIVRLPGVLREFAGGAREIDVPLGSPATVGELLAAVDAGWPLLGRRLHDEQGRLRAHVRLYVDGEDVRVLGGSGGIDAAIPPGAEVIVVPAVSGG
jgi:molybdopterin converting factor small subunit